MTEQINKTEKPKEVEPDEEALEKIKKIQSSGIFGGIKKDLLPDVEKELFGPVNKKFLEKYPDINWDTVTDKEFPKDYAKALEGKTEEFNKIIKNKSATELLKRAKKLYEFSIDGKWFGRAYDIAREYLDHKSVKTAAEKEFEKIVQKMKKSAKENEKTNAANEIFSTSSLPEIKRSPEIVEEAFKILLKSEWFEKKPRFLYYRIKARVQHSDQQLPKSKEFFNFVNPFVREEIKSIIEKGDKQRAIDQAEFYEKKGFLDLESDNDLFEELTKRKT